MIIEAKLRNLSDHEPLSEASMNFRNARDNSGISVVADLINDKDVRSNRIKDITSKYPYLVLIIFAKS